jgi:hypothetical protein
VSKTSTAAFGSLVALGGVALVAFPILRLIALSHWLGMNVLAALMLIEAVVGLARAAIPLRSIIVFRSRDAMEPRIGVRAVMLALASSALAVALLATTVHWWAPVIGYKPSVWLMAVVAFRFSGWAILCTLAVLRRWLALALVLVDLAFTVPMIALFSSSLVVVFVVSAMVTWLFVLFALTLRPAPCNLDKMTDPPDDDDRWKPGSWLDDVSDALRRPVFAAYAGVAMLVPFSAATTLAVMLELPFIAFASAAPSRDMFNRFLRGAILAFIGVWFVHACGPAIYRAVFPASFGDGSWLHILAWSNLAALPLALRGDTKRASQLRVAIAAALAIGMLIWLTAAYGAQGVLWTAANVGTINAAIAITTKKSAADRLRAT